MPLLSEAMHTRGDRGRAAPTRALTTARARATPQIASRPSWHPLATSPAQRERVAASPGRAAEPGRRPAVGGCFHRGAGPAPPGAPAQDGSRFLHSPRAPQDHHAYTLRHSHSLSLRLTHTQMCTLVYPQCPYSHTLLAGGSCACNPVNSLPSTLKRADLASNAVVYCWGCGSVVQPLLPMCKTLVSTPP